MFHSICSR